MDSTYSGGVQCALLQRAKTAHIAQVLILSRAAATVQEFGMHQGRGGRKGSLIYSVCRASTCDSAQAIAVLDVRGSTGVSVDPYVEESRRMHSIKL